MARNPALAAPPDPDAGEVAGVILAGGLSRRMGGGDKCLLPLGGRPILAHVVARLAPQVGALALNANGDPARFAAFGLPVLADGFPGFAGPLAGVLAGMDWAAGQGIATIATAAADTPFFPSDLVVRLGAAMAEADAPLAVAMTEEAGRGHAQHPTFGLWRVDLRDDLRTALEGGLRRVRDWAARHGAAGATFAGDRPFFNVNAPGDLTEAEARLARDGAR